MDDINPLGEPARAVPPETQATPSEPTGAGTAPAVQASASTEAVLKFKSCRWRSDPEDGAFCTHRDVLPFAGKEGFKADSWCPDCAFYKLRRTPKKRDRNDYAY